jgi:3-phenylpropionate/trans-cinnamate dioxygenase ferredoxin subunit
MKHMTETVPGAPILDAFHAAGGAAAIAEGAGAAVTINGWNVLLCRHGGAIYAIENRCGHRNEPLTGGRLRSGQILCPHHGARFNLKSGAVCSSQIPAKPIRVFETHVSDDGQIEVLLPLTPPVERAYTRAP